MHFSKPFIMMPPKMTITVRPIKPRSIGHAGAYQPYGVITDCIRC